MRNYGKISWRFTLVVVAVLGFYETFFGKTVATASLIFPLTTGGIFLYTLFDLFILSHDRSEIDGVYRHIPMLVAGLAVSLSGMVLSSRILNNEGLVWLWINFVMFCIAAFFIARTVISSINNSYDLLKAPSPFCRDKEITNLFWLTMLHIIIACSVILIICYLL